MTLPLLNQVAFVTGGSRGIGRASALAFADAGADVAICHVGDEAEAKTLVQAVTARGRPETRLRPQASISSFTPRIRAEPMSIFSSSAVRAPMSRLCFLRR